MLNIQTIAQHHSNVNRETQRVIFMLANTIVMFVISEGTSNEGTEFTVALSPSQYDHYHAELIIHAR